MSTMLPERNLREDGPKPVTAKCCRALLPSDKVELQHPLFLHRPLFKLEMNRYLIHIIVLHIAIMGAFHLMTQVDTSIDSILVDIH